MTWPQLRELADQVRTTPLKAVLRLSGAQPDRYDRHKWHTSQGVLSVSGAKFINWNHAQGGGGAIDLVMHLHRLGFAQAVQWLAQSFPGGCLSEAQLVPVGTPLALPKSDPSQLARVRQYLMGERRLPLSSVESLIDSGVLYADAQCRLLAAGKRKTTGGR